MANASRGWFSTWRAGRSDFKLHVLSVFSLSVAFVCLAASLLVVANISALKERWSRAGRATVYLKDAAPEGDVNLLLAALEKTPGVTRARRVTSEEARREIVTTDDTLRALPAQAFPSSVELAFDDQVTDVELKDIALKLRALPAVETVETYEKWTERLSTLLGGGVTAALCLAAIVLAAVVSVVGSTMRLLLQRRKIEVEVLKLVGATDGFVRKPFVLEGATQGGLGALLAILILGALFLIVRGRFDVELANLVGLTPTFLPWQFAVGMVTIGAGLGALTALVSLRKLTSV